MLADHVAPARLEDQIETALNQKSDRPRCVHSLYEELLAPVTDGSREHFLEETQAAADRLVAEGRAKRAFVSAIAIGAHCEDSVYWSARSANGRLDEFGPEFEEVAVARRLASHFVCHGL